MTTMVLKNREWNLGENIEIFFYQLLYAITNFKCCSIARGGMGGGQ